MMLVAFGKVVLAGTEAARYHFDDSFDDARALAQLAGAAVEGPLATSFEVDFEICQPLRPLPGI